MNPFQTIQREEVGTILKITPQINEGDAVMLKIEQEDSSVAAGTQGAVDLITNKRTVTTTVLVDDGGVVVLGGLITDTARESENRVPILGSIPIIGELFKTRSGNKEKRNLMLFIRPTILRDGAAGSDRDEREVQRDAQPAAEPSQGQGHAAARRAPAAVAADRRAVEVRRSDRGRQGARAGNGSDQAGGDRAAPRNSPAGAAAAARAAAVARLQPQPQ